MATQMRKIDERTLLLRYVQPGLVGLIDGTLSTLAPIFAAALLSGSHAALFVGGIFAAIAATVAAVFLRDHLGAPPGHPDPELESAEVNQTLQEVH